MVKVKVTNNEGLVQHGNANGSMEVEEGVVDLTKTQILGFIPDAQSYDIAAGSGGALSVESYINTIATDGGGDAFTLADGTVKGQMMKVILVTDGGGDATLTIDSAISSSLDIITFANVGDTAELMWNGSAWRILGLYNTANGGDATPTVA